MYNLRHVLYDSTAVEAVHSSTQAATHPDGSHLQEHQPDWSGRSCDGNNGTNCRKLAQGPRWLGTAFSAYRARSRGPITHQSSVTKVNL